jgi:hypothetical protein
MFALQWIADLIKDFLLFDLPVNNTMLEPALRLYMLEQRQKDQI